MLRDSKEANERSVAGRIAEHPSCSSNSLRIRRSSIGDGRLGDILEGTGLLFDVHVDRVLLLAVLEVVVGLHLARASEGV